MEKNLEKRFFTNHSKSSAMVVSLVLHAILAVVALSFVAVTVITKDEQNFESKQVSRPRMAPKKLQVPVKIKKQKRRPKLRQRIVVKHQINRNVPDIKMPEISGIKGGLGAASGVGLGDASGIGFNMPEINVFGVRGKGEKVFIALDTDAQIMRDEVGGKRAYALIKRELARVIEGLDPTTLFNLAVFDHSRAITLFPKMVPATRENTGKVAEWLEPLNAVTKTNISTTGTYGLKTLGKGGTQIQMTPSMNGGLEGSGPHYWFRPAAKAMVEQADTVFILTGWWGVLRRIDGQRPEWEESKRKKWEEYVLKSKEEQKKENSHRAAKGEPEQIFRGNWSLVSHYFPDQHAKYHEPQPSWYHFTGKEYEEALKLVREGNTPNLPAKSGLTKRKKNKFSLNVIFFAPQDKPGHVGGYEMLAKSCNGDFCVINGLEAIKSFISGAGD